VDRFTWGVVVGAVALVVAGIVLVLALRRAPGQADLTRPEGVVLAYVEALDAGRYEDAWELLARQQQMDVPRDEFVRQAAMRFPGRRREGRVRIDSVAVEGTTARVELSRTYSSGGGLFGPSSYSTEQSARLERQGGDWRITVPPDDFFGRTTAPVRSPTQTPFVVTATPAPAGAGSATSAGR
jgi:hypothetical protein